MGSSIYSPEELQGVTSAYAGRELTLEELQAAADAITQLYLNEGYITSRAVLVDQAIENGIVRIQVIEGSLDEIQIEGTYRLSQDYIRSRIELGAKTPLRTDRLEDQLRLLRVDPNIANLEASLRASDKVGQSTLVVRVTESNNVGGTLGFDNYTPESVGGQRTRAEIFYRNLMGNGETLIGSWDRTFIGGSDVFRLTYRQPVNARNGTIQAQLTVDRNEITQPPFDRFDISGETERYDLSFRQPVIRNPRQELALSIGLTHQEGQTFVSNIGTRIGTNSGARANGTTRVTVVKLGQDFVRRDPQGAWAFQSQFSFGTDWFGAVKNEGNIPDSLFFSWLGQGQRVQRINDRHLVILQADIQLTPDPLLSSQQFVIGGGQSVRGYRQNARAGDSGFRFSVEDRITVRRDEAGRSVLQLAPFFDAGVVWNHDENPNTTPTQTFLSGLGFGVLWQPLSQLDVRFDLGLPLVDVEDDGNDTFQSRGMYFNVNYRYP
jgi:hemolysin activation/secretion protein